MPNDSSRLLIREMASARVPLYDNDQIDLRRSDNDYKQPTKSDNLIQKVAITNREYFAKNKGVLDGRGFQTDLHKIESNKVDSIVSFDKFDNKLRVSPASGYIKFTGPNKVEVARADSVDCEEGTPATWNGAVHNKSDTISIESKKGVKHRNIPLFIVSNQDDIHPGKKLIYKMTKRCERIFQQKPKGKNYPVPFNTIRRYYMLLDEYRTNADRNNIPDVFRTVIPKKNTLIEGDLVYFRVDEWGDSASPVIDIAPVAISRKVDQQSIAQHLLDSFLPCANTCLNECDICTAKSCKIFPLFQEGYPVNGLCPSCHLFGTSGYKGRVRFGFAKLQGGAKFCKESESQKDRGVTLPLQERPNLTFAMPNDKSSVPGRKFYVHHQGWKSIVAKRNPVNGEDIRPNANNRTTEPLAEGNKFSFEVFFENLRDWELGLLRYTIELETGLAHKLGMGKAFGFGSVEIRIDEIDLRQAGNWKKATAVDIRNWAEKGQIWLKEKLSDDSTSNWDKITPIYRLRKVLTYVSDETIRATYPKLKKESKEDSCFDYVEMKKKKFPVRDVLSEPWRPWYPIMSPEEEYKTGEIKYYNDLKKYGFIEMDGEKETIHFKGSEICKTESLLSVGDKVKFIVGKNDKGKTALKITRLKS